MSDFFRVPAGPSLVGVTTGELARLAHKAEDTNDDVLLMQVWAELESRQQRLPRLDWTGLFREHYIRQHRPEERR